MLLEKAMKRLEEAEALDQPARMLADVVHAATRPRLVKNALSGTWLGHRFHPAMVPLPIGFWSGALVFDMIASRRARWAADVLVGSGVVSAVPTAAAGLSDWADTVGEARRVGRVHASCNTLALLCYSSSLVARLLGWRKAGVGLGLAGATAISAGGFLGGHLTYRQAAGVNHSEEIPHRFPSGWHPLSPLAELPEGGLPTRVVAGIPLLVHREGNTINVLSDVCSHLSGPLHEGKIKDVGGDACVVCPWHRSTFALRTGEVKAGPATSRQPVFETRVTGDTVEVCLPGADG